MTIIGLPSMEVFVLLCPLTTEDEHKQKDMPRSHNVKPFKLSPLFGAKDISPPLSNF
jgi:hypothetical protein